MSAPEDDMKVPIRGRLAPSPTGAQHVGNARTYLVNWLWVRSLGGTLLLRIEDIDSPRIKLWASESLREDLGYLGLDWDEGPDVGGPTGPYIQSARIERYRSTLETLRTRELVYPCTCSRSDIVSAGSAPHLGQEGSAYPGTCRHRKSADAADLEGRPFCWRFRATGATAEFYDLLRGDVVRNPNEDIGDFVVWKTDGSPAYQLAVVVDDAEMDVSIVIRGDDLVPSTFRQLELYRELGKKAPAFAHLPLVIGPDGKRLAKRHGDTKLSSLQEAGVSGESLLGLLAWSLGQIDRPQPISARELLPRFDAQRIPREPFVLTADLLAKIGYRA